MNPGIMFTYPLFWFKDQVNEDRAAVTIERDRILLIPLPEHFCSRYTGQFFNRPVPCNHLPFAVNGKCCIREEIDDIGQPFF